MQRGIQKSDMAEDERILVGRMLQGDMDARNALAEKNMRVAVCAARRYASAENRKEDLLSIACVGLVKALNNFDPGRKAKLSTYASRCIENEILMYLRRKNRQPKAISLDGPLPMDGRLLITGDRVSTDAEAVLGEVLRRENNAEVQQILNGMCEIDKRILQLRFGLGQEQEHTQAEVAARLAVTQSYISKKEKKLLEQVKKQLIEGDRE